MLGTMQLVGDQIWLDDKFKVFLKREIYVLAFFMFGLA